MFVLFVDPHLQQFCMYRMYEGARRTGSIANTGCLNAGGMEVCFCLILNWQEANSTELVRQPKKLGFRRLFSPEDCKEGNC